MREVKVVDLRDEIDLPTNKTVRGCEAVLTPLYFEGWHYRTWLAQGVMLLERNKDA